MSLQRGIAREKNRALVGRELTVLVDGPSDEHEYVMMARHAGQAPEIDGQVYLSGAEAHAGQVRRVLVTQSSDYDLVGELCDEPTADQPPARRRVGLRVVQTDGR